MNNVGPDLREFFNVAGVSENHLKDEETRNFIYTFIQSHGGVDKAIESIKVAPEVSVEQPKQYTSPPAGPPPPPVRNQRHVPPVPPQPTIPCPPPPPPPPPPPVSTIPCAPPPPPPLPNDFANNTPRVTHNQPRPAMDSRSALLEQIRQGTQLKAVDTENDSVQSSGSSNGGDNRDRLLSQIRQGQFQLKTVEVNAGRKASGAPEVGGLAGALARALAERQKMIHRDSDDSSEESSDDEWGDEE